MIVIIVVSFVIGFIAFSAGYYFGYDEGVTAEKTREIEQFIDCIERNKK